MLFTAATANMSSIIFCILWNCTSLPEVPRARSEASTSKNQYRHFMEHFDASVGSIYVALSSFVYCHVGAEEFKVR